MHFISNSDGEAFIAEELLARALSKQLNIPTVALSSKKISSEVLALVPLNLCKQHGVIPFAREDKFLDVAMDEHGHHRQDSNLLPAQRPCSYCH